jgi:hypothetical protein
VRKKLFIILSRKNGSLATVIFSWVLTLMVLANVMATSWLLKRQRSSDFAKRMG